MSGNVYVTSAEGQSGKSAIALGIVHALGTRVPHVGVYRPVTRSPRGADYVLALLLAQGPVVTDTVQATGVTYEQLHADPEAAMATIVQKYKEVEALTDATVVLGSDYTDVSTPTELTTNARIAANLGTPVLLVLNGIAPKHRGMRTPEQIAQVAEIAIPELLNSHAALFAIVVNRADPAALEQIKDQLRQLLSRLPNVRSEVPVWVLPEEPVLSAPTVKELLTPLDAQLLSGDPALLEREAMEITIAGMSTENVLRRLNERAVVIVPADRSETLIALVAAHEAHTFPSLAGVVVNGDLALGDIAAKVLEGLNSNLPLVRTSYDTFETAERIMRVRGRMKEGSTRKIETALANFEHHIEREELLRELDVARTETLTPLMFEYELLERARQHRKTIVLPEGDDDRILEASAKILAREVADIILLGDPSAIASRAGELGLDLTRVRVINPEDSDLIERFAAEYARLRAHKGMSLELARDTMRDVSYFGTMMVHLGLADGMVSGAKHTTAHTIRPGFEIIKTSPGTSIVSSVFFMALADRVLVYGDCAVNPDPDARQLADIAKTSAQTADQFGIQPRVAMLSYSTGSSGSGADVEKVREATELLHHELPALPLAGPIQYDAAADPRVGASKMPDSEVAGHATVFIFPDLNTGNNTYKAVQRSAGAVAIGPVLQGLNKPINDLSRGALVPDIVNTVAITAIQAQGENA